MRRHPYQRAFTLIEMMVTLGVIGMLGITLGLFTSSSSRFITRNLATNHSHEATRMSDQRLLKELRDSGSSYRLFTYDGSTYTDISPVATNEVDALSGQFAGTRANGVRFRQMVAGPLTLTTSTAPTAMALTFSTPTGTTIPVVGDKVVMPLISQEYDVTAVSGSGTTRTVTIATPIGYTLNTTAPNLVTGYIYRRVAFTVYNQELRYHANFTGTARDTYEVVRGGVTSPSPFSLIFTTATAISSDALNLRVSMELADLGYSARRYKTGVTTLYTVFPPRNQPTAVASTN
jgi:prepilin-type N-terminal cleavage/methylation domain-containing protein